MFVLIVFIDTLPKDAFDTSMYAVVPINNELLMDMLLTDTFEKDALPLFNKLPYVWPLIVDKEMLPKDAFWPDMFVLIVFSDTFAMDALDTIMYAVVPIYNVLLMEMLLIDIFEKDALPFVNKLP